MLNWAQFARNNARPQNGRNNRVPGFHSILREGKENHHRSNNENARHSAVIRNQLITDMYTSYLLRSPSLYISDKSARRRCPSCANASNEFPSLLCLKPFSVSSDCFTSPNSVVSRTIIFDSLCDYFLHDRRVSPIVNWTKTSVPSPLFRADPFVCGDLFMLWYSVVGCLH